VFALTRLSMENMETWMYKETHLFTADKSFLSALTLFLIQAFFYKNTTTEQDSGCFLPSPKARCFPIFPYTCH